MVAMYKESKGDCIIIIDCVQQKAIDTRFEFSRFIANNLLAPMDTLFAKLDCTLQHATLLRYSCNMVKEISFWQKMA